MGKQWKQWLTLFLGAPKSLQMVIAAMKLKDTYTVLHFSRNVGLLLRRCGGQGPHAEKTMEPRGFSRVAAGFSIFDEDFRLSLQINDLRALPNSYPEGKILKPIYKKVSYVALPNLHRRAHSRRLSLKVTPLKRLLEKKTHRPLSVWLWLNSA